jgi:hypothetical protein
MAKGPYALTSPSNAAPRISVHKSGKTVAILVEGTFTGTLQPQVALGGQTPVNTEVTPAGSTTLQGTITAAGMYFCTVGGVEEFILAITALSVGTATVYLNVGD